MLNKLKLWFASKVEPEPKWGRTFTDEERELALRNREQNVLRNNQTKIMVDRLKHLQFLQQQKQMKEQIDVLENDIFEEEDEEEEPGEDELFSKMITDILTSSKKQPTVEANLGKYIELNDIEIKETVKQMGLSKKQIETFKKLDKPIQLKLVRSRLPALSEATVERALEII